MPALHTTRTDADLITQARLRAPDALTELFHRYGPSVHRAAFHVSGTADEAADVLQEVMSALPELLARFDGRGSLEGWLRRVAVRRALMRLRSQRRRREDPIELSPLLRIEQARDPLERITIERAIESLPEALRVVFVLKEMEGYTHAEISELLGIGRAAAEVRLHRARRKLRDLLSEDMK